MTNSSAAATAAAGITSESSSETEETESLMQTFSLSYLHNGLEGLALGSLLASSIFHLIPHAFDLVGQGK